MPRLLRLGLPLCAGLCITLGAARAHACDGSNPEQYSSDKTVWCVDPTVWADHQAEIETFFPYGDQVIDKLTELFSVSPDGLPFTIVAKAPDGFAQTPSRYGPGVEVTGDAFWNELSGVQGFWGYLLVLHEFVNQWTGLVTGGWPTDWWADHRSPFPNAMDEIVLAELGLQDAADVQHGRMAQDAQVQMFLSIFDRPGYGFVGYQNAFKYIQDDDLSWFDLRDPPSYADQTECVSGNPSALLAEYVIAYLSLPAREDLTPVMTAAGVGAVVDDLCPEYTPSTQNVGDIADAHCGIAAATAAGLDVSAASDALRDGNFAGAAIEGYACATDCPAECACSSTTSHCVAPWRGDLPPAGGTGGTGGTAGSGGSGIGTAGTDVTGGSPAGGSAGSLATGGAAGSGGQSVPNPNPNGGSPNSSGTAASDGESDAGCGCRAASSRAPLPALIAVMFGFGLLWSRRKRH